MRKICKKCTKEKELDEFNKHKRCKLGVNSVCKECKKDIQKIYDKRRRKISKQKGICQRCHKEFVLENRTICLECSNLDKERTKVLKQNEICSRCHKNFVENGSKCIRCLEYQREYDKQRSKVLKQNGICVSCRKNLVNKDNIKCLECERYKKKYDDNNKDKRNKRYKKRIKNDSAFKMRNYVSSKIWKGLKKQNSIKNESTWKYIKENWNLTPQDYVNHINMLIKIIGKEGLWTWKNHGKVWEIHHIVQQKDLPYDSYENLNFRKCWASLNLKPVSIKEHRKIHRKRWNNFA